jgi:hypothetical protein
MEKKGFDVFATTMEWKCGKNIMEETIMKRLEL